MPAPKDAPRPNGELLGNERRASLCPANPFHARGVATSVWAAGGRLITKYQCPTCDTTWEHSREDTPPPAFRRGV